MRVLGLDPGTTRANPCGVAVIDILDNGALQLVWSGAVWSAAKLADVRIMETYRLIRALVDDWRTVDLFAHEHMFVGKDPRATHQLTLVCGAFQSAVESVGKPVVSVYPVSAKAALVHGKADKQQMIDRARQLFGAELVKDVADACGIALAAERQWRKQELLRIYEQTRRVDQAGVEGGTLAAKRTRRAAREAA